MDQEMKKLIFYIILLGTYLFSCTPQDKQKQKGVDMYKSDKTVYLKIVRDLSAEPEKIFDIFSDPKDMKIWWTETTTFDIDFREGGNWAIIRTEGETVYTAKGKYLQVKRPHQLVYTYSMPQFSPNTDTISIDIKSDTKGSTVSFMQKGEDIAGELGKLSEGETSQSEQGWNQMFDLIETHLEKDSNSN